MKAWEDMTTAEKIVEAQRRTARRAAGKPVNLSPAELEQRSKEEDDRLEKLIQAECRKVFLAHGCRVYWFSQKRKTGQTPGIPDLYVFRLAKPLLSFWFEVKPPGKELDPDQVAFKEECELTNTLHAWGGVADAWRALHRFGIITEPYIQPTE